MSECTLVTGLWDINRENLHEKWKRPFSYYLEKFSKLLETNNNLIIFGEKSLKDFVFEKRSHHNTQFIETPLDWFRDNEYYPLIQNIRRDINWLSQNDWISKSPQAFLEMYNPIVMSKMLLVKNAILNDKFNSDYFYWIDAGINLHEKYYRKEIIEEIQKYTEFFFVAFPYKKNEIHGFSNNEIEKIILEYPDMVSKATFFGGNKKNISLIYPLYYDLMSSTLKNGFMGTEETLFTILTYKYPELIDYYLLEEENNGNVEGFFKTFKFSPTEEKFGLFKNKKSSSQFQTPRKLFLKPIVIDFEQTKNTIKKSISVLQVGTNRANDNLSTYLNNNLDSTELKIGIFVEPNRFHNPSIKKCYKKFNNVFIENIAIKPSNKLENTTTLYFRDFVGGHFEVASCSLTHVEYHDYVTSKINSFVVDCLSLEELLDKYSITDLDWLLLDIEGIDSEVIMNFDWKKYNIKKIEFEHLHLGNMKEVIRNKFLDMGYVQTDSLHEFDWAFTK